MSCAELGVLAMLYIVVGLASVLAEGGLGAARRAYLGIAR